jgi:hypothetical protein
MQQYISVRYVLKYDQTLHMVKGQTADSTDKLHNTFNNKIMFSKNQTHNLLELDGISI